MHFIFAASRIRRLTGAVAVAAAAVERGAHVDALRMRRASFRFSRRACNSALLKYASGMPLAASCTARHGGVAELFGGTNCRKDVESMTVMPSPPQDLVADLA